MDKQRKSRGGPIYWLLRRSRRFWISAVLLMPAAYVASFGPACWISSRVQDQRPMKLIYRPLLRCADLADSRLLNQKISWYSRLGTKNDCMWFKFNSTDWDWVSVSVQDQHIYRK